MAVATTRHSQNDVILNIEMPTLEVAKCLGSWQRLDFNKFVTKIASNTILPTSQFMPNLRTARTQIVPTAQGQFVCCWDQIWGVDLEGGKAPWGNKFDIIHCTSDRIKKVEVITNLYK